MINPRLTALRVFRTLPILGLLFFAACPQMQSTSLVNGGSLGATREEKKTSEKILDSEEIGAPPTDTPPPMEPIARRIEGGGVAGEVSDTPGPLASRDDGILSAPISREGIQTIGGAVRMVRFPASFQEQCSDIRCIQEKVRSCQISPEVLSTTTVEYPDIGPNYDAAPGSTMRELTAEGGLRGYPPVDIPKWATLRDAGYFHFFVRKRGVAEKLGDSTLLNPTCADLAGFMDDPRADYVGERLVLSAINWVRIVYFPSGSVPRKWTNAREFLAGVTEEQARAAKTREVFVKVSEDATGDNPYHVRRFEDILTNSLVQDLGYSVFFMANGFALIGTPEPGVYRDWRPIDSLASLRSLIWTTRVHYLGDRSLELRFWMDLPLDFPLYFQRTSP